MEARMPADGDSSDGGAPEYPTFDHGDDLFVLHPTTDSVEFCTGLPHQFVRSDRVVDPADVR